MDMNRRSFIRRCTGVAVSLECFSREVIADAAAPTGQSGSVPLASTKAIEGAGNTALSYVGSFATPTLTDTWVKPNKTASINFGKHTKMAYCPLTKLLYICGGDGQGWHFGGNDSGTIDTVATYDVATHTYAEDFVYRGAAGEVTPRGLDFIAFTWAPKLNEFWLGPGYCWNFTAAVYPFLDFKWMRSNYASYSPLTKKFTDRGPRDSLAFDEGKAGSWDTKRDRLLWFTGASLKSLNPATGLVTQQWPTGLGNLPPHRIETSDTWYDEDTDDFYCVQLGAGKVYAVNVGKNTIRVAANLGVVVDQSTTRAVVYITDTKHVLVVYSVVDAGANPWKLANLTTGKVESLNLFAPGITRFDTGAYHPPLKTIVLTGGGTDGNLKNGASFHHYRSNL